MCGRFTVTTKDSNKVADRFQMELEKALEGTTNGIEGEKGKERIGGRFNVAPSQEILTVRLDPHADESGSNEREARMMRWGLVPRWAKDLKVGFKMINARDDRLLESRAYKPLVSKFRHRCLIVADGFYEWMKAEDPKQPRQPWHFTVDGGEPFAFAGICTRKEWDDAPDGWLYSATIITTKPNKLVSLVHDRMPVILPGPDAEAAWLRPGTDLEEAIEMCTPLDASRMDSKPANPKVNKVGKGNEGPEMLVPPDGEQN